MAEWDCSPVWRLNPARTHSLVILLLKGRHLHPEDLLHFGRKGFLHIFLHSPEKKRL
jgi:hypothetical protein